MQKKNKIKKKNFQVFDTVIFLDLIANLKKITFAILWYR